MKRLLDVIWKPIEKLLLFIGKVNSVILLSIFYYLILGPLAIFFKLTKLFNPQKIRRRTYWTVREQNQDSEENLLRQF